MNIKGNDENKNSLSIREDDIFKKAIARGFHCVGEVFIFTGKLENRPERSLLCNGSSITIPSSEEDPYWELYQVIGTIYNEENTPSGQFCVPNLFEDNGRFIRASLSDDELGKTQIDEIRNIISFIRLNGNRHNNHYSKQGALKGLQYTVKELLGEENPSPNWRVSSENHLILEEDVSLGIGFDASLSNSIYGASQHVTPLNIAIKLWIRES